MKLKIKNNKMDLIILLNMFVIDPWLIQWFLPKLKFKESKLEEFEAWHKNSNEQ